jgi:hypothetical protein
MPIIGVLLPLTQNPKYHIKKKHIDIQYHFTCEQIQVKQLRFEYKSILVMVVDFLLKVYPKNKH